MHFHMGIHRRYAIHLLELRTVVNIKQFSEAGVQNLERIRDIIHDLSVAYGSRVGSAEDYDQMSLEQFVISKGGSQRTVDMVRIWSRVMLGVESKDLSAQFFIEYNGKGGGLKQLRSDQKHGGQYLRFRKGISFSYPSS